MIHLGALLMAISASATPAAGLVEAVREPDECFRYEIVGRDRVGTCDAVIVRLTSQSWRGVEWWHWLSILVPESVDRHDRAVLFIAGGSSRSAKPSPDSRDALRMALLAAQSRAVVAVLQQVPNQPLFDGLVEDDLIAFTFDRFLNGEGSDWPLLIPMVESAVRAMDAIEALSARELGKRIDRFVVSGASKRGWTTWLTAAADRRVIAIAPMVIDVLNMRPQMEQQRRTYGGFSEHIRPYTERRIQQRMDTEAGRELNRLVDPYEYRERLTMPKLVVLGTNDPYWTVDASNLYFPELPGPKALFYLPNAGHGLGMGIVPTLTAFFRASMRGETLPQLTWRAGPDGKLVVEWGDEVGDATLWLAESENRDFREARWTATALDGEHRCEALVEEPESGWRAGFVEVEFDRGDGERFRLSTGIRVVPERFPHDLGEGPDGGR